MVATNVKIDPSQTINKAKSQPLLKIQSTNYKFQPSVDAYPDELKMLIVALNNFVLSIVMSASFSILMTWLSLDKWQEVQINSIVVFNKTTKIITFQLTNDKKYKLTKKQFAHILNIPNVKPLYKVLNEQVVHMFNEMVHQSPLPEWVISWIGWETC